MEWGAALGTGQEAFEAAVRQSWTVREGQGRKQQDAGRTDAGLRGTVTGGAHLDALANLIKRLFVEAGFDSSRIDSGSVVELPGYFRPEKRWDVVIVHGDLLVAAVELKSQASSIGNNYNNRAEEAIGGALDIRMAQREGRLGSVAPWLGYLFLLGETQEANKPVSVREPLYKVDPEFRGASYKKRYELLCRRLVSTELFDAACLVTSSPDPGSQVQEPASDLSYRAFADSIRAHAERLQPDALPGQMSFGRSLTSTEDGRV